MNPENQATTAARQAIGAWILRFIRGRIPATRFFAVDLREVIGLGFLARHTSSQQSILTKIKRHNHTSPAIRH